MGEPLELVVDGVPLSASVIDPGRTLLRVLREDLGRTGTKEGCDDSECGACMVLIDGRPVNSCSYLALQAAGRRITTVEGLAGRATSSIRSSGRSSRAAGSSAGSARRACSSRRPPSWPTTPIRPRRRSRTPWPATSAGARATSRSSGPSRRPRRSCARGRLRRADPVATPLALIAGRTLESAASAE